MFSATDLANFLSCHHLSTLERAEAAGTLKRPFFADPGLDLLKELGLRHEQSYLSHLVDVRGIEVFRVSPNVSWAESVAQTNEALCRGVGAIYQGTFLQGSWHGRSDFLVRVNKPSSLGNWSYEPLETKLARSTKAGALIQLCFYSDLLSQIQGVEPDLMHIVLGRTTESESYAVRQYIAYFRKIKSDFHASFNGLPATYPEPTEHCEVCSWYPLCDKRRRDDDDLCLVAGITRHQRKALATRNVVSVAQLAKLDLNTSPKIDDIGRPALMRIKQQARLQVEGRGAGHLVYELLATSDSGIGLASLPAPSEGDIFLDIEGDPFASEQGLEYLIGTVTTPDGATSSYQSSWSLDRAEEKIAFETLIADVMKRWRNCPDLHIYHYAPYEPTAIKRLVGQHGTCVDEVDQLLRAGIFVDLYRIVRQGIRASVESYSIKSLEPLYGFTRAVPLREAVLALQAFETSLALGDTRKVESGFLANLESYNRDDCLSARQLRQWLEERRSELEARTGAVLPRPALSQGEPNEDLAEHLDQVRDLIARLVAGLPAKDREWTDEQRGRWLLAQMLEYHRREDKSAWWEYFRLCELSDDELIEDKSALGGLVYLGSVGQVKKSVVHRYRYPPQDHTIDRANSVHDPKTRRSAGTIVSIDERNGTIDIKRSIFSSVPHPTALIPQEIVATKAQQESLMRLGSWVADNGIIGPGTFQAARDLLVRQPPRVSLADINSPLIEHQLTDRARQVVLSLRSLVSVLPVQGPPGSGKTFTGARMVVELVSNGSKVGITAVSHKVITNLLDEICKVAREIGFGLTAIQRANDDDGCDDPRVTQADDNPEVLTALTSRAAHVAAGTAWLWAGGEMSNSVDVLVVDEAGQMSLADVLAISQAAPSLILLGDPQQLNQPKRGVHPPGVDVSALDHLLDGRATIDPSKGLFLKQTWRLHPDICAFTSELFYDGRLTARPENKRQRLNSEGILDGSGLRFVPVPHTGNQNKSPEEVEQIAALIDGLLQTGASWTKRTGETVALEPLHIVVVTPYNAQVSALAQKLPIGVRVGTVDKFQGQEAPVVFYSMASSTPEDAPRGMEFLYSLNRLNVATSRAQCIAVIVASPAIFGPQCKTPRQMTLANALCRFFEMAAIRA